MTDGIIDLPEASVAAVHTLAPGHFVTISSKQTGRKVAILRKPAGPLAAFDLYCWHQGAALGSDGVMALVDIEDAGSPGACAVRCPRHGLLIDVDSGLPCEGSGNKESCSAVPAGGAPVQRTHTVLVEGSGIRILLSDRRDGDHSRIASDDYNVASAAEAPLPLPSAAGPGGQSRISWAQRKHRAVSAVVTQKPTAKKADPRVDWQQASALPPPQLFFGRTEADVPLPPTAQALSPQLRQMSLDHMLVSRAHPGPSQAEPSEPMDVEMSN